MNFLATSILFSLYSKENINEIDETCFWIFVSIMEKYKLKEYFLNLEKMLKLMMILET